MDATIETTETDTLNLARDLAALTGETVTDAVTNALRERIAREKAKRAASMPERVKAFVKEIHHEYDTRPVTQQEWDEINGETP